MSSLLINKVAAAVLVSALGFIGINKFSEVVIPNDPSANFAYTLAPAKTVAVAEVLEIPFPSATWIAAQDVTKGAKVFKKCASCHNVDNGGKNGTGPALWNMVGQPMAKVDGFSYSSNMAAKGGTWGYAELDEFLTKPKNYIPKTKMAFNGLKKETDRAALIAFLRVQADNPIEALTVAAPIPGADGTQAEDETTPANTDDDGH